jgi:glycine cleavage system regulatory protein
LTALRRNKLVKTCGEAGMTEWILTLIGPDRPGLVEVVAERVVACGGNWMASRMAHLGGKFAGIALVAVPETQIDALKQEIAALESDGLVVHVESAGTSVASAAEVAAVETPRQFLLQVVGGDRPGIVRELSGVLAANGINVESLATEYTAAPMSGGPLFRADVQFALPPAISLDQLRSDVEAVAGDLMVDFSPVAPL